MIKLESIYIEEVRGIRKLELNFNKEKFAISGPNGSGKSGVIDSIEFGLTGQMGRLTGRGTKGLSVGQHGPHVDKVKFPDAAFVRLKLFLGDLNKSVTLTRFVSNPKKPKVEPDSPAIRSALAEIAGHPEITLSRREILRFILVEPSKRSEEIQALLKLEEIGETRKALYSAQTKLTTAKTDADTTERNRSAALQTHLQIIGLKTDTLLEVVNKRRKLLNLPVLEGLTKDTNLDEGLVKNAASNDLNKESALREAEILSRALADSADLGKSEVDKIVNDLVRLEQDPSLLAALQQRSFVESGLNLVNKAECPLCDKPWPDIQHLKDHLQAKLDKSAAAKKLQDDLIKNANALGTKLIQFAATLTPVATIADTLDEKVVAAIVRAWETDLESFKAGFGSVDKLRKAKARFEKSWLSMPEGFSETFAALVEKLKARPDQSATIDAQTFLTTAQVRLSDYREARKNSKAAAMAKAASKAAHDIYCAVQEAELNALYEEVQQDFSTFYKALNGSDEEKFSAKLKPTAGSLDFDVNFYERGLFPPAAYHSEGHQDGMGVCLYLALMKRLLGNKFTLSLLDDVVMSVDSGHRYEFCKLLKAHSAETQFIITTHDRLWAEQMKSAGLVTGKTSIVFYGWTIDTGPLVQSDDEIWDEINAALAKGKIESAAGALRRHLEYAMSVLADQLGARPQYRADGTYELDEMMSSVLSQTKKLWGKAADAAKSWKKDEVEKVATERKRFLSTCDGAMRVEQWTMNKLVHYNAWANFGKSDFEPVVKAFKEIMECFRCKNCDGWIYALPRVNPQSLRCSCANIDFNLTAKS